MLCIQTCHLHIAYNSQANLTTKSARQQSVARLALV